MLKRVVAALVVPVIVPLAACGGGSPPTADAEQAVRSAVYAENPQAYDAGAAGGEVVDIALGPWKKDEDRVATAGLPERYESTWTATFRTVEPLAAILQQVDGTKVVKVCVDAGERIAFQGTIGAMSFQGKWEISAFSSGEPWQPYFDRAGGLTMGYQVFDGGNVNVAFRNTTFVPLSKLAPCVVEGSPEWQKMEADRAEAQSRAMEAQAERVRVQREAAAAQELARQQALEAERKRAEAEAAERRRAAEEQQRLAQEAARKRAEEARRARLQPTIAPFASPTGLVVTAPAGTVSLITEATVDDAAFSVRGRGVDLRTMPFRDFTFDTSTDERGLVTFKSSLDEAPLQLRAANGGLVGAGLTMAPATEADRKALDATVALGQRLGAAAPLAIAPEVVEPAALAAREAGLSLAALTGTARYLDRVDPRVSPLFAGDLAARRPFAWKGGQIVSIRLAEPVRGKGLYYRGLNPTEDLVVTINGVHRVELAAVPKLGAAVIPLPDDVEIWDVRFEARGTASARTIGLVQ